MFELDQWDRLATRRPVVGVAGHDAHARLGLRGVGEPYDGWVAFDVPAYAALFASFANVVRVATPLSGDAGRDAAAVIAAIGDGQTLQRPYRVWRRPAACGSTPRATAAAPRWASTWLRAVRRA